MCIRDRPYAVLFALALVIAILGRIGLGIAASTGILAFDYISASDVPILDVICSILTGSAFVGFLFAAGLALSPVSYTHLDVYKRQVKKPYLPSFMHIRARI